MITVPVACAVSLVTAMLIAAVVALPAAASTTRAGAARASLSALGEESNGRSETPALSADGNVVAFTSIASNLIPGDTNRGGSLPGPNGGKDVFVRDLSGTIERVSVRSDGSQSGTNSVSDAPAISGDGRFVAFHSTAGLDPSDFNGRQDIFVHDRATGETERASYAVDGGSVNNDSSYPAISADGRYVAFYSFGSNIVEGDTNRTIDIFVRDRSTDTTERVSVASDGTEGDGFSLFPSLSADGRFVTFVSQATNLVPHDVLGVFDVFIHDRETRETEQVSVTSNETIGNEISYFSSVSGDGRYVAFDSTATNLVPEDTNAVSDVFIRDRQTGVTDRISVTSFGEELDGHSFHPSISADGRFVSFTSEATDVVDGAANGMRKIYLHDRLSGTTTLVSVGVEGEEPNGATETDTALHTMSDDGLRFAISSAATNLVTDDTNDMRDVFTVDAEIHFGVVDLELTRSASAVSVSGAARATGVRVAEISDADDDAISGSTAVGGEITGATVAYRPVLGDLLATLHLAPPPKSPVYVRMFPGTQDIRPPVPGGTAGIAHTWSFTRDDQRYELRALPVAASGNPPSAPFFGLYRCDAVCLQIASLRGGHTTTGTNVVMALPLELVGAEPGSVLRDVRVHAGLGDAVSGGVAVLDDAVASSVTIPTWQVSLGIAPAGTPESEVAFDVDATTAEERFTGVIDTASLASGAYEVWAKACLGDICATSAEAIALDQALSATDLELLVDGVGVRRTLHARLTDRATPAAGISGRTIQFFVGSELIGSALTDLDGVAVLATPPRFRGGSHDFEARFEGDDSYLGSAGSARS